MSTKTTIGWTESTWNPVRGCTKVSPGCKNCYAETFAERFRGVAGHHFEQGFDLRLVPEKLDEPLAWRKPRMIFVNSMSDLFHEGIDLGYIHKVFDTMGATQHQFQVLTKRSERLLDLSPKLTWHPNVWMGVSVESSGYTHRIDDLRATGAKIKFLSLEPLLGPLPSLNLKGIDWVIVGGESGPHARPMDAAWVREIHEQCIRAGVAFFFKQWGNWRNNPLARKSDGTVVTRKELRALDPGAHGGTLLDGKVYQAWPAQSRQRSLPVV